MPHRERNLFVPDVLKYSQLARRLTSSLRKEGPVHTVAVVGSFMQGIYVCGVWHGVCTPAWAVPGASIGRVGVVVHLDAALHYVSRVDWQPVAHACYPPATTIDPSPSWPTCSKPYKPPAWLGCELRCGAYVAQSCRCCMFHFLSPLPTCNSCVCHWDCDHDYALRAHSGLSQEQW